MSEDCIDRSAFERLQRIGKAKLVREMIGIFLDFVPRRLADARAALESGDWEAMGRAVHPLRSSAGNVGAFQIQELAGLMEQLAKEGSTSTLPALMTELDALFLKVKALLEEERERLPT